MKKSLIAALLIVTIVLTGCTVITPGSKGSSNKTLQTLGLAYSSGTYTMQEATCTGFVTSGRSAIYLSIPVSKILLDGQKIKVTEVKNASLRTQSGANVEAAVADLSAYIDRAQIKNDGAVIYLRLKNENQWKDSSNNFVKNNTPVAGTLDIVFSVSE